MSVVAWMGLFASKCDMMTYITIIAISLYTLGGAYHAGRNAGECEHSGKWSVSHSSRAQYRKSTVIYSMTPLPPAPKSQIASSGGR